MDCGGTLAKYILFLFNIIFVVIGILIIIFGSIMMANIGDYGDISEAAQAHTFPVVVLILGCLIFVISFLGCCGAIRENSCCTITYSVIMLLLFVVQLGLVIFIWVQRAEFLHQMTTVVDKAWNERHKDGKAMDVIQISFDCCGKNGFSDYTLNLESIPNSCCGDLVTSCPISTAMLKTGCSKAFVSFWDKNTDIIRFAGLIVALIELVAFVFACCLANQVRNYRRRYEPY